MHERSGRNSRPQSERRNSYRTRAKRTTKRLVAGMLLLLAQRARQDGRWQDKRYGQKLDGPSIPPKTLVEYIPITAEDTSRLHQFGKKTLKGTILVYVLCVVRRWVRRLDDDRLWRFFNKIRCHRNSRQQCQMSRLVRDGRIRTTLCKRKSKTSSPSKTVTDSTRKPRARRWCWNRRRRQRGEKHRRFVDQEWKMDSSTSWRTSFWSFTTLIM